MAREDVLRVKLVADGAGQVKAEMLGVEQSMGRLDTRTKGLSSSFGQLRGIIGAISVGALAAAFRSVTQEADNMGKMAQATGLAVEELTGLNYAAKLSSVETEKLGASLRLLSKNATDTANGTGEAKDAFAALGISVVDASGKVRNGGDLINEIADKFAGLEDGSQKTALAMRIFGESGAAMIPLLNQGSEGIAAMKEEADALGVVLSQDLVDASTQINDNLTRLGVASRGTLIGVFSESIPVIAELSDMMVEFSKNTSGVGQAAEVANTGIKLLASAGIIVKSVFQQIGTLIGGVAAAFVEFFHGVATFDLDEIKRSGQIVQDVFADLGSNLTGDLRNLERVWDSTAKAAEKSGAAAANAGARTATVLKSTGAAAKAAQKEIDAYEKRLQSLIDTIDPVAKETRDYMQAVEDLDRAWIEGRISGEEYDRLMMQLATDADAVKKAEEEAAKATEKAAKKREDEARRAAEKAAEELQRPFEQAAESIQSALADGIYDGLNGNIDTFRDFFDTVKQIAFRAIAEIGAAMVFSPQYGGATGGAGYNYVGYAQSVGGAIANGNTAGGYGGISPTTGISSLAQAGGGYGGAFLGAAGGALYGYEKGGTRGAVVGGVAGYAGGAALTAGGSALAAGWGASASAGAAYSGAASALSAIPVWGWVALAALAIFGGGKKKPSNRSAYALLDLADGERLPYPAREKSSENTRSARDSLVDATLGIREALTTITGGTLSGQLHFDVGERDGIQVGGSLFRGADQTFATGEDAIKAIFRSMLNNLQGVDSELRAVFSRIDLTDIESAIADLGLAAQILGLDFEPEQLTAAAQAIRDINSGFDAIIDDATRLGISVDRIEAARQRDLANLTSGFNDAISESILAITDPLQAALDAHAEQAEERLRNARDLGADLVEVERLTALERQKILDQFSGLQAQAFADDIGRFLLQLRGGGSYLSSAQTLSNAQTDFDSLLAAARDGDAFARSNLTAAASNLINASRNEFGSGELFFERLGFIERTLQNVAGLGGESGFELLGRTVATGNDAVVYELQQVTAQVVELRNVVATQQAALDRLLQA